MEKREAAPTENKRAFDFKTLGKSPWFLGVCIGITVVVVFSQFIFSNKMLVSSDQMAGLDSKVFLKEALIEHGQLPMWFNVRLGGMPTVDALFGDALYPPSLLIYSIFPLHRAVSMRMVFHVMLAGIFFFLLMYKGFGTSPVIAFIGALFYMYNPQFFSHIFPGHDGKMYVIAWLPFVVWRMKCLMERATFFNASLMGVGISFMLLSAHVQLTYFVLMGLFLYWLVDLILKWRAHREIKPLIAPGAFFWIAVAIGLLAAFIQFFPATMYVRDAWSVRGVERGFDHAASWALHWPEFFSLWVPEFGNFLDNYWSENQFKLNADYAGGVALLLAVLYVVVRRRKPWSYFWAGIAVLAVLYGLGAHTPVFHAAYYLIPGVKKFRAPSMVMFWYAFAVALLATLFCNYIAQKKFEELNERQKKKWQKGLFIALASITGAAMLFSIRGFVVSIMQPLVPSLANPEKAQIFENNFSQNFLPALWLGWWLFASVVLIMALQVIRGKLNRNVFIVTVALLGCIDMLRIDMQFVRLIDPRPYFHKTSEVKRLNREMEREPFRCFALPGALPQNGAGIVGLEGIGGFHDNELRWYREFRGDQRSSNYLQGLLGFTAEGQPYLKPEKLREGNAFLSLANTRYILSRQRGKLYTFENRNALPRISFAPYYTIIDSSLSVETIARSSYDIRTTVGLFEKPSVDYLSAVPDSIDSSRISLDIKWESYTPNYRSAKVTVHSNGLLRISEVFYPGWEIRVDGEPVEILRADHAWMAVPVRNGTHTIELRPHSLYFRTASMVSFPVLSLLVLYWIALGVRYLRQKRQRDQQA
jgi:hypothetical protein